MDHYSVCKKMNSDGYHVVHKQDCPLFPDERDRLYLGYFSNSIPAVRKAENYFELVSGCEICSNNKNIYY